MNGKEKIKEPPWPNPPQGFLFFFKLLVTIYLIQNHQRKAIFYVTNIFSCKLNILSNY